MEISNFKIHEGNTPKWLQKKIRKTILDTFKEVGEVRGELCLYSSKLIQELLLKESIKSMVIMGEAHWNTCPLLNYNWSLKNDEFHSWVFTQYGEYVDLTCDDIHNSRRCLIIKNIFPYMKFIFPLYCWDKVLKDRQYIPKTINLETFEIDDNAYKLLRKIAFKTFEKIR